MFVFLKQDLCCYFTRSPVWQNSGFLYNRPNYEQIFPYIEHFVHFNHDHCIEYDSVCITGITFLMLCQCHTYHAIPTKYYYALYTSMQYHSLPSNIIHYTYIVKNTILTIFKDYKRNYQLIDFKEKASWLWVDRLLWFKVKEMCIHFGSGPLSHDLHLNLRICFTVYVSSEKI